MKSTGGTLRYLRLRAPREHGQALIDPPLADVAERIQSNIAVLQHDYDFHGRSWTALRQQARSEVLDAALQYSRAYRDVDLPASRDLPLVLSGHQPQLFHTGVWFKNFALASLAKRGLATPIHLLIDNDTLASPSLRVPTGSIFEPRLESIPLDSVGQGVPWEDRQVVDRELFESFGQRVTDAIQPFVSQPLIQQVWPFAIEAMRSGENLGACLSHARHRLEESWGLNTLELPLSKVCELDSFHRFTRHLLIELPRLHEIYNDALLEYRRVNRVRSRAHPVPELAASADGWIEAPFWIWQRGQTRSRLFVRPTDDGIELSDRAQICHRVGDNEQLAILADRGIVIRPRALVTTMFARLILGDVFFHGLGGAKYDQLTDEIIRRFFGCRPPSFLTVTATAHLPLELPPVTEQDVTQIDRLLRDLQFHAECHVDAESSQKAERLVERKRHWISTLPPHGDRQQRHREIVRANNGLQQFVASKREKLLQKRRKLADNLRIRRILASREFSFCLFSEETLRPLLLELSHP